MLRLAFLLTIILTLSGCSSLAGMAVTSALGVGGGGGIDTELVIGEKEIATEVSGNKTINTNSAEVINIVNEENFMLMLIAIIGWMAPSPSQMYAEVKNIFSSFFSIFRRSNN